MILEQKMMFAVYVLLSFVGSFILFAGYIKHEYLVMTYGFVMAFLANILIALRWFNK